MCLEFFDLGTVFVVASCFELVSFLLRSLIADCAGAENVFVSLCCPVNFVVHIVSGRYGELVLVYV
jgi:hypothetical protein